MSTTENSDDFATEDATQDSQREAVVQILQIIQKEGLPNPRDIDAAADAIMGIFADD